MDIPHPEESPSKAHIEIDISQDRRWLPFCLGIALGPSMFVAAGMLSYICDRGAPVAIILPYSVLFSFITGGPHPEQLTSGILIVAVTAIQILQFCVYGIILEIGLALHKFRVVGSCLIAVHMLATLSCFLIGAPFL